LNSEKISQRAFLAEQVQKIGKIRPERRVRARDRKRRGSAVPTREISALRNDFTTMSIPPDGDLLAEIICVTTVNQQDATLSCQNYTNHIPIPSTHQNITVTGPYVLDNNHGWKSILSTP